MFGKNGGVFSTLVKLVLTASLALTVGLMATRMKRNDFALYMSSETRVFDKDALYSLIEIITNVDSAEANAETIPNTVTDIRMETFFAVESDELGIVETDITYESISDTEAVSEEAEVTSDKLETQSLPDENVVYWVKNGEVWHLTEKCPSLSRSKTILSGTVDEAVENGKTRVCKRCGG